MAALIGVAILCAMYWKRYEIAEAIDRFKGGGGPRTPMHPSPANDAAIVNRRVGPRQPKHSLTA